MIWVTSLKMGIFRRFTFTLMGKLRSVLEATDLWGAFKG